MSCFCRLKHLPGCPFWVSPKKRKPKKRHAQFDIKHEGQKP